MKLLILGAGGHAKVVLTTALEAGWEVLALLDDNPTKWGERLLGIPVHGPLRAILGEKEVWGIIAIGDNHQRRRLAQELKGVRWATLIHPRAYVHPSVHIGEGTVVFAGAVIQPAARLGSHVIINTGAIIEHDVLVEDFAHLAPGVRLAGGVQVGEGCLVGIGAVALPGVKIGKRTIVGAGSVVTKDLPERSLAYGVPAQVRRKNL